MLQSNCNIAYVNWQSQLCHGAKATVHAAILSPCRPPPVWVGVNVCVSIKRGEIYLTKENMQGEAKV